MSALKDLINNKQEAADYMKENITTICNTIGTRAPGSDGEYAGAKYMAAELEKNCGVEKASIEEFKLNPNAFYGWIYITISLALAQLVLYFFVPIAGVILMCFGFAAMILEFILYKKAIDPLFKERTSHNITAIRKCSGEVKARVLFNGHMDSAWNWIVNQKLGGRAYVGHIIIAVVGVVYMFILSIVRTAMMFGTPAILTPAVAPDFFYAGIASLVFLPFILGMYGMWNEKKPVPGATDNLTGCWMGIGILNQLEKNGIVLENTEVGVALSGSEEAGLRGTKAWCQAHANDFKDVPTYIISFDSLDETKDLIANYRDLNSTVATDVKLNDLFVDAAAEVGVKCTKGALPFFGGSTDAAGFAQGGFRVAGITAMCQSPIPQFYHTVLDTPDRVNKECLKDIYSATINMLDKIDQAAKEGKEI